MRRTVKKLALTRETLQNLETPAAVVGGVSNRETICGYTCYRQCLPVPSVDIAC
jgi:hypothetical protein